MVYTVATHREILAEALKKARLDAGYMTHGALAKELHMDRSVVTRAESVTQPVPSDALLASWAAATRADPEELTDLAARAKNGSPEWFVPYLGAESSATMLRSWGFGVVPGLLQIESYARAVLSVYPYSPERLTELLATRMERQKVLDRAYLAAVIDVSVLSRCFGSPQVMADQLAHLVAVAERSTVALHVLPEDTNTGAWASLDIASSGSTATVCLTTALDDVTSTAPDQIDGAMQAFDRVMGASMTLEDSLHCLRSHEGHWKERI